MKTLGQDIIEILREHAKTQRLDQRAKKGIQKWLEQENNLINRFLFKTIPLNKRIGFEKFFQ